MTRLCQKNITAAFTCFIEKNLDNAEEIEQREDRIDEFQSNITDYLARLFRRRLSINESQTVPRLIHCINDAERVGDHAENLVELTQLVIDKKLPISVDAKRDLHNYFDLVDQQFKAVIHALREKDAASVSTVLELEEEINSGYAVMSDHHVTRLNDGTCTVNTGVIFLDVIANLEKIADHLTNIAERVEVAAKPDAASG